MRKLVTFAAALALSFVMAAAPAQAYIGPGLGAGAVSAVLGVLGSIFLGLVSIIYYPFKRLLKRKKARRAVEIAEKPAD